VPPLPPGAAVTRWQQFCWIGSEALSHLDAAGQQGWELVSVSLATTGDIAIPPDRIGNRLNSTIISGSQLVMVCFKRPLPPARMADGSPP
jgi:hypothetical protein